VHGRGGKGGMEGGKEKGEMVNIHCSQWLATFRLPSNNAYIGCLHLCPCGFAVL
jgi:hypothetical protein